jgi:hypothetical protein
MEIALPVHTNTVFAEATVGEDGALYLRNPPPSLKPGARVLLTISPQTEPAEENATRLIGSVIRYDDPYGPATDVDEWEALRGC